MPKTQTGSRLLLSIEILDEEGEVIEATPDEEPFELTLGQGELPPTVEDALLGLEAGASIETTCAEGEAFGPASPEAIVSVPLEEFPEDLELIKGELIAVNVEDDEGEISEMPAVIIEVNPDGVILDANHPLAGKAATFRVKIEDVLS